MADVTSDERQFELTPFQRDLILSVSPRGTRLMDARPAKRRDQVGPLRVRVAFPSGAEDTLYLRLDRAAHGVEREARVLPVLRRLGLPVPELLAGPVRDSAAPELGPMAIYTALPGINLLERSWRARPGSAPKDNDALADQLLDGIELIRSCTDAIARDEVSALLPHEGLMRELRWSLDEAAAASPNDRWDSRPWLEPLVERLLPRVATEEHVTPPTSFWNGDFNPANFLSDGTRLTGLVDFSWAGWHDPHYGLARFTIYPWVLFDRPRLFRRYRERHGLSEADFALRSAVHCVTTLLSKPHGELSEKEAAEVRAQLEQDVALIG